MDTAFKFRVSSFAIMWLRAYDFGLEEPYLVGARESIVEHLDKSPIVQTFYSIDTPASIDEIDSRMFDVRYQERSRLVRIHFYPFVLSSQELGTGLHRSSLLRASLLLDMGSGFGVFNVGLAQEPGKSDESFTIEEIGFLARQWLLTCDDKGKPLRLAMRLPLSGKSTNLYIREVMNYLFLQTHNLLWKSVKTVYQDLHQDLPDWGHYVKACIECDPGGCPALQKLNDLGLTRSLFPTSFGPVIDIWGIEGWSPLEFDSDTFLPRYEREVAWLFTDSQRTTLGEPLRNQRNTKSLALYVWPNHALYINQDLKATAPERIRRRVEQYGCLDVEIVRILEIINLQSALLRAFDRFLDQQLEQVVTLAARDQRAIIQLTEQRRKMSHSTRSFDFYNLFHTAYWEPLYARLLEHPHLRLREASNLVDLKLARLDEEIQQAIIIQDRMRQQQERRQELAVLRGLHTLGLENDVQSKALVTINFLVSATASFGFTQVLAPALTSLTGAQPTFSDAYPLFWILLNLSTFLLVWWGLNRASFSIIQRLSRVVEIEGQLNVPLDSTKLSEYSLRHTRLVYLHLNADDWSGYLRIQKSAGVLVFEFDRDHIYRYSLFLQGQRGQDLEKTLTAFVYEELNSMREHQVIQSQ